MQVIITNLLMKVRLFYFQRYVADPVIFNPNIDSRTQSVKLGQPWNITCQARGNPAPTVEWKRKNGNKTMTPRENGSTGAVLFIDSVIEDSLGIYFCVAVNSITVTYAYVELGKIVGHGRGIRSTRLRANSPTLVV